MRRVRVRAGSFILANQTPMRCSWSSCTGRCQACARGNRGRNKRSAIVCDAVAASISRVCDIELRAKGQPHISMVPTVGMRRCMPLELAHHGRPLRQGNAPWQSLTFEALDLV